MADSMRHAATFTDTARAAITGSCAKASDISVGLGSDTTERDVLAVARAVVPRFREAESDALRVSVIDGGLTNALFAVTLVADSDKPAATVLVRVFGESTERVIDRERDGVLFEVLSELGVGPRLLGTFSNGRVEQFIDGGRTLEPEDMANEEVASLVGHSVGQFHAVLRRAAAEAGSELWQTLDCWLKEAEAVEAEGTALSETVKAMFGGRGMAGAREWLVAARARLLPEAGAALGDAGSADDAESAARASARAFARETVLCHCDLLGGNLLLVGRERRVQLLDFEYSAPGPRAFDWGNHFGEMAGMDCDFERFYPAGTDAKMPFLRSYVAMAAPHLVERAEAAGAGAAFWEELAAEGDRFAVAGHLFWGLWAVVQARWSAVDFDFASYAARRLEGGLAAHGAALGEAAAAACATPTPRV